MNNKGWLIVLVMMNSSHWEKVGELGPPNTHTHTHTHTHVCDPFLVDAYEAMEPAS